jgi:serine/threonine-protein kinase RsbW
VTPRHPELIRLELPARYAYLHLLSDCIADMLQLVGGSSDDETLLYNVQLAAHEVCTNIVHHAYDDAEGGRIEILLSLHFSQPPCLSIDLYDEGRPFDKDAYMPPQLETAQVHGYGIFLIRSLMDTVMYTPTPGRNHWRLTKKLLVEGK